MPVGGDKLPKQLIGKSYGETPYPFRNEVSIPADGTLAGVDIYPESQAARAEAWEANKQKLAARDGLARLTTEAVVFLVPYPRLEAAEAVA